MLEDFLGRNESIGDTDLPENKIYVVYDRDIHEASVDVKDRNQRREIVNNRGVKSVYLYTKDKGALVSDELRKRVKIDSQIFKLPAHIAVFKDRIRLISYSKKNGILIKDAEFAETLRSIMRLAEECSKKPEIDTSK